MAIQVFVIFPHPLPGCGRSCCWAPGAVQWLIICWPQCIQDCRSLQVCPWRMSDSFRVFADAGKIAFPLSLGRVEWFRPSWVLSAACQPAWLKRDREIRDTSAVRDLLLALDREVPAIKVFDPFPILCPVGQSCCSTYCGSQRIFRGGNHLTEAGALKLYPSYRAFLAGIDAGSPHGSSPIHFTTSP